MSLRVRVLLTVGLALVALVGAIHLIVSRIWFDSLDRMEAEHAHIDVERVRQALSDDLDRMAATGGDWAQWDDTYAFVEDGNAAYVAANLRDNTLPTLGLDAMVFVHADGRLVAELANDAEGAQCELPESLRTALAADRRIVRTDAPVQGLLALSDGIWLVASQPILRSDESGPARGSVGLFRKLGPDALARLRSRTRLDISLTAANAPDACGDVAGALDRMRLASATELVLPLDDERIAGYAQLPCLDCDVPIVARTVARRDIRIEGARGSAYLLVALIGTGSVLGLLMLALLERAVLARVHRIGDEVRAIGASHDVSRRASPNGTDELGRLVTDVNGMLDALERADGERRAADAELRASEAKFRRVVENISDGIVIDDAEGRVVFANGRFSEIFGIPPGEVANARIEDYVAPGDRAALRDRHERRIRGEDVPTRFEYEGRHRDGSTRWIEVQVAVLRDEQGRITGTQSAQRDVTARRAATLALNEAEERLRQAQKMEAVGRLAGGVAHDFNNVLTVIQGYGEMLSARLPREGADRLALDSILEAASRAAVVTQQLLTFSRKQVIRPSVLDVNSVVSGAVKLLRKLIGEDVEVALDLAPDLGRIVADVGQIHQVIMNLAVNARDAMPRGGTLTIMTRNCEIDAAEAASRARAPAGRYVRISVRDTGCGMPPDVVSRIFEPFFTTKEQGKGTGLGLAIVYAVVVQCGGCIDVESAPGRGTTFTIDLPRVDVAERTQPGADAAPPAQGHGETVLLAEDEAPVRAIVRAALERAGFKVLDGETPAAVLAVARTHAGPIDVLVSDVVMPQMSGPVLATHVREAQPGIGVLFMSGHVADAIDRHLVDAPGAVFLQKPFKSADLLEKVREVLAARRSPATRS